MNERRSNNEKMCSPKENSASTKAKSKSRGKKRKRRDSGSSSEYEELLSENALEMEKNLHASAVKNNLDEISVRKILKKVVTNDHVLALVKLREEEEDSGPEENSLRPKLTRAKVKELMKVSPKAAAWNLENLELTPIKHIPVKTRPEVKALIAQELPEDEDDEEYEPTHEDVPSDDDQGMESCSDLDSQPRTPATPRSLHAASPKVVKDGPFKVPQDVSTPTRRKLDLEEEATIALRTRSKLSLSATSIEHIESTFVPPDDLPMPAVDDLWNQFLNECLNPASTSKNEDDDEADPEYNVAADPDANDEDEEALGNSIIKISKKELNDLVTELFNIMPEASVDDELMADKLANSVLTEHSQAEISSRWEGKQEPLSDDEGKEKLSDRITFEKRGYTRLSVGNTEKPDTPQEKEEARGRRGEKSKEVNKSQHIVKIPRAVDIAIEESEEVEPPANPKRVPPLLLQRHLKQARKTQCVTINLDKGICVLPEQIAILQQQVRQHVQLATSNYLQLYIHPVHWRMAPPYKEYLETLSKLCASNPKSVVNVCNLRPALELVNTWEKTVSANTPENKEMVEFILKETQKCSRRYANKNVYVGDFHSTFKQVVANSTAFLYPHLLPPTPYRAHDHRRYAYTRSEDELIALGLDQFWDYVESNPAIYKPRPSPNPRHRWGLSVTLELVVKHMFPWIPIKVMLGHVQFIRKSNDKDNPINKFFENRTVEPVKHKLLPYNPALTLYEQPEHEVPKIWLHYLAKTSRRFRNYLFHRSYASRVQPEGVEVNLGQKVVEPSKAPLPIDFTQEIVSNRINILPRESKPALADKFDIEIAKTPTTSNTSNLFKLVETSTVCYLMPLPNVVTTIISTSTPISTSAQSMNIKDVVDPTDIPPQGANPLPGHKPDNQVVQTSTTNNVVHTNLFRLVETSSGAYLMPLTNVTNTVTSNITPISTPAEIPSQAPEVVPEASNTAEVPVGNAEHCSCCIMLRKICKRRQTTITEYFSRYKFTKQCYCKDIKYPKISNRLRILVRNFKSNSMNALQCIDARLKRQTATKGAIDNMECNPLDMDDFVIAASFHLKLLTMTTTARDSLIKRRVYTAVSKFNPEVHDPVDLSKKVYDACSVELVDMYKEFLCFLTPEQADKCYVFRDYFVRNCIEDLVKRIEKEIPIVKVRTKILRKLRNVFYNNLLTACQICTDLLSSLVEYPDLAHHVFSLFPHRKQTRCEPIVSTPCDASDPRAGPAPHRSPLAVDYEPDHSTSEAESNNNKSLDDDSCQPAVIKSDINMSDKETETQHVNVRHDSCDSCNNSMTIVFDDEFVKPETAEWKRDEDKLILEVLKEHLTPEERKDKTILEIIEEKDIISMIAESLTYKSKNEVTNRVLYLLQILVFNENT